MKRFGLRNWIRQDKNSTDDHPLGRRKKPRAHPNQGTSVLIVDDSQTIRSMLRIILKQSGYETLEAEDGASGIKIAADHKPSLIFMDVMMPGMNGFQATRRLRKSSQTTEIPIIIMSGNKTATKSFWTEAIGANGYMVKPFTRRDLFTQVESALHLSDAA